MQRRITGSTTASIGHHLLSWSETLGLNVVAMSHGILKLPFMVTEMTMPGLNMLTMISVSSCKLASSKLLMHIQVSVSKGTQKLSYGLVSVSKGTRKSYEMMRIIK